MKVEPLEVKQELEEDDNQEKERHNGEFSELSVIIDRSELKAEFGIEALELAVYEQCERFTDVPGFENNKDLDILYDKHAVKAEVVIGPTEIIDCNKEAIKHDRPEKQINSSKKLCCKCCSQIFTLNVALNAHKKKCIAKYQAKLRARGEAKAKEDKENRTPIVTKEKSTVKRNKKTIKPDKNKTKLDKNTIKLNIAMKPNTNTVKLVKNKNKLNKKAIIPNKNTATLDKNTMKLNKNAMKPNTNTVKLDKNKMKPNKKAIKPNTDTAKLVKNTMKLNKNEIKLNDKRPFACTICKKTFTLIMNLKRHNKVFHYQTISFVCKNCGKEFLRKDYLIRHKKVCRAVLSEQKNNSTNKNVYECVCGKILKDSSNMRRHKRKYCKILAIPKTSYVCVCGVIIEEPSKIMHHEKKNCKILALPKKNSKCVTDARRKTAIPSNLDPDDKRIPEKTVQYVPEPNCKCICGKIIIDPSNLARHKNKYCKILAKKSAQLAVTCDCCNKVFGNEYLLECHRKVVGTNPKKYDCDFCDKSYAEKRNLIEHIGRYHCESLEQKCKICNKVFSTKRYLMKHQDIHKSLSYFCKFCNKILRSRWGHRAHEKKCKFQK